MGAVGRVAGRLGSIHSRLHLHPPPPLPANRDQALLFDQAVCPSQFVLFLSCTEEVMLQRLLKRGETSGRADDNAESIKKRFRTFLDTSMPVVEHYEKEGKVVKVDSMLEVEEVGRRIEQGLRERGMEKGKGK